MSSVATPAVTAAETAPPADSPRRTFARDFTFGRIPYVTAA